jgi:hypothetical protein
MTRHKTRIALGVGVTTALILTGVAASGGQRGSSGSIAPGVVAPGSGEAETAPRPKAKSKRKKSVVSRAGLGIAAVPVADGGFGQGEGLMPVGPAADPGPAGDRPKVFGPTPITSTVGHQAPDWRALPYQGTSIKGLPLAGRLNDRQNEFARTLSADDFVPPTRAPYFDWIRARQDSLRVIGWRGSIRSFQAAGDGYRAVVEFLPMLASAEAGKGTFTPDRIVEVYDYADGRYQLVGTDAPQNRVKMVFYH